MQTQPAANSSVFALDDNCVQYAQLNHSANEEKRLISQQSHKAQEGKHFSNSTLYRNVLPTLIDKIRWQCTFPTAIATVKRFFLQTIS